MSNGPTLPTAPTTPMPQEVYATFAGFIDQTSVQRIFTGFTGAMAGGVRRAHLLFQSAGGVIGDGIALYNFFRALPIELTLYNAGTVASIGSIAYLGAQRRQASAHAAFMLHRTQSAAQPATADRLQSIANSVAIDDRRTEAIIRQHLSVPDDRWTMYQTADLWFDAREAVAWGMASAIGEFAPPAGTQIFNV